MKLMKNKFTTGLIYESEIVNEVRELNEKVKKMIDKCEELNTN